MQVEQSVKRPSTLLSAMRTVVFLGLMKSIIMIAHQLRFTDEYSMLYMAQAWSISNVFPYKSKTCIFLIFFTEMIPFVSFHLVLSNDNQETMILGANPMLFKHTIKY